MTVPLARPPRKSGFVEAKCRFLYRYSCKSAPPTCRLGKGIPAKPGIQRLQSGDLALCGEAVSG